MSSARTAVSAAFQPRAIASAPVPETFARCRYSRDQTTPGLIDVRRRQIVGDRDHRGGRRGVARVAVELRDEAVEHVVALVGGSAERHHAPEDVRRGERLRRRVGKHDRGRDEELVVVVRFVAQVALAVDEGLAAKRRSDVDDADAHRLGLRRAGAAAGAVGSSRNMRLTGVGRDSEHDASVTATATKATAASARGIRARSDSAGGDGVI